MSNPQPSAPPINESIRERQQNQEINPDIQEARDSKEEKTFCGMIMAGKFIFKDLNFWILFIINSLIILLVFVIMKIINSQIKVIYHCWFHPTTKLMFLFFYLA